MPTEPDPSQPDPSWPEYRQNAFGDPYLVWHDGPYFEDFRIGWEHDPELATRMLDAGVAAADALAATTIRELDLTPAQRSHFVAILDAAAAHQHGDARVAALRSLYHLTGDPGHATGIAEELHSDLFWSHRLDAARALRDFPPSPALVASVADAVSTDSEYLVRYHAANTLLAWAGRPGAIETYPEWFDLLTAENAPVKWAQVGAALAAGIP